MNRDREIFNAIRGVYNNDFTGAIQGIAGIAGIAVAWIDRERIDAYVKEHRGHGLTDEEWEELGAFGASYNNFLNSIAGPDGDFVANDFIRERLDKSNIPGPAGDAWRES